MPENCAWAGFNKYSGFQLEVVTRIAGHHRHIFRPILLLNIPLRRMKTFSGWNTFFGNLKFSWFLQKKIVNLGKKAILWNIIIWYAFYRKFATFSWFRKISRFFRKTKPYQKIPNFVCFEKSYYFSRILRQICYKFVMKTFHGQKRRLPDTLNRTLSIRMYAWKKRSLWVDDFPPVLEISRINWNWVELHLDLKKPRNSSIPNRLLRSSR